MTKKQRRTPSCLFCYKKEKPRSVISKSKDKAEKYLPYAGPTHLISFSLPCIEYWLVRENQRLLV